MDVLYILKVEKLFGWRKRPLTACQPERLFPLSLLSSLNASSLAQRDWLLCHASRIPVDHGLIVAGGNIRTPRIA